MGIPQSAGINPASPEFISDQIGNGLDAVEIQLGSDDPVLARGWTINEGILSQPGRWRIEAGTGSFSGAIAGYAPGTFTARELFARYPPRTPYTLSIGGHQQFSGYTDRRCIAGRRGNGGTSLLLSGRDTLAPLHSGFVTAQQTFGQPGQGFTYRDLVSRALTAVGLDPSKLVTSNSANRNLKAGIPLTELDPPITVDGAVTTVHGTLGASAALLQAKVGERWLDFLRRHLDRAGLMIWAAGDGSFVLSAPNANQSPRYQLYRSEDQDISNVLDWEVDDDATNRHTEVIAYGRGGGRKFGRVKAKGNYGDQEMLDYGYEQAVVIRDANVQTAQQAEYFARRKLAEERRDGWHATYTVAGHTLPVAGGSGQQRAVITVDTTIDVQDSLSGLFGTFYIESLTRERSGNTQTTIRLMRPQDLVFGDLDKSASGQTVASTAPSSKGPKSKFNYFGLGIPPQGAVSFIPGKGYVDASGNVVK